MKPWNPRGIEGVHRFLQKIWRECVTAEGTINPKISENASEPSEVTKLLHETIKKVGDDIESMSFNTAISKMMIFVNALQKAPQVNRSSVRTFLQILAPFAPHFAEELWERLGEKPSVLAAPWPTYDPAKLASGEVKLVFQVNGKLRGDAMVPVGTTEAEALKLALANEKVATFVAGKPIRRVIYISGKILNIVVEN